MAVDCVTFCQSVDTCNGCAPTDSMFKILVLHGLCCISQNSGGGSSASIEKMCDACFEDTSFQINSLSGNVAPNSIRFTSTGTSGNFQGACAQLSTFTIYWGDGSSSAGNTTNPSTAIPSHTYAQPGQYVITFRFVWSDLSVDEVYLPVSVAAASASALSPLPAYIGMRKASSEGCFIRRYNADGSVTDLTLDGAAYVITYGALCECPQSSNNVVGSPVLPSLDQPLVPIAGSYVQLAVTDAAAVALTPPAGARGATVQLQANVGTGPARFTVDGTVPTTALGISLESTGVIRLGATAYRSANPSELSSFRIISSTGSSHVVAVQFYS